MSDPPRHAESFDKLRTGSARRHAEPSRSTKHLVFRATIIRGAGRGKALGTPTFNLALEEVPKDLLDGIYAVRGALQGEKLQDAVMHYGPRPAFDGSRSCEVHLLGGAEVGGQNPSVLSVEVVKWLRDVRDFETPEALKEQIAEDISQAKKLFNQRAKT